MSIYNIMWTCMSIIVFSLVIMLALDVCLYIAGADTLSSTVQRYFGASVHSWRVFIFGFIVGAVCAHFTRWN